MTPQSRAVEKPLAVLVAVPAHAGSSFEFVT
jgi:hypothetical protein